MKKAKEIVDPVAPPKVQRENQPRLALPWRGRCRRFPRRESYAQTGPELASVASGTTTTRRQTAVVKLRIGHDVDQFSRRHQSCGVPG